MAHDAERLGNFTARWLAGQRPAVRQLVTDYLSLPLNAYRHEALVKRLFKGAEWAGDDALLGLFLVAIDRSIRRARRTRTRYQLEQLADQAAAEARVRQRQAQGYHTNPPQRYSGRFYVNAWKPEEVIVLPGNTTVPRPPEKQWKKDQWIAQWHRDRLERRFTLFSVPTKRYLRHRAWRYFRKAVNADPQRYRAAAVGMAAGLPRQQVRRRAGARLVMTANDTAQGRADRLAQAVGVALRRRPRPAGGGAGEVCQRR